MNSIISMLFAVIAFTESVEHAALLSGSREMKPQIALDVNVNGLYNILKTARLYEARIYHYPRRENACIRLSAHTQGQHDTTPPGTANRTHDHNDGQRFHDESNLRLSIQRIKARPPVHQHTEATVASFLAAATNSAFRPRRSAIPW